MRTRPRSPYEGTNLPPKTAPTRSANRNASDCFLSLPDFTRQYCMRLLYAYMGYVTFLYENNETEFSKRLHVVPRGCVGMFLIELIPAESRFSFDCGFRVCAIMPSAGLSGPVESRLRRASKVHSLTIKTRWRSNAALVRPFLHDAA